MSRIILLPAILILVPGLVLLVGGQNGRCAERAADEKIRQLRNPAARPEERVKLLNDPSVQAGLEQRSAERARQLRQAAESGYPSAMKDLAIAYFNGMGVPKDYEEAAKWFRKAADHGEISAKFFLGIMYERGCGVPKDYVEAVKWYRTAAEQGHVDAKLSLGLMYELGNGVPQDDVQALMWFDLAGAAGQRKAPEHRDRLAAKMTPAQIAQAQKSARMWQPKK